jgi:hypothetical protein
VVGPECEDRAVPPAPPTDRRHWPKRGAHLKLLQILDELREAAAVRPSLRAIGDDMRFRLKCPASHETVRSWLTGRSLPSGRQVLALVNALGGGTDERERALRARDEAERDSAGHRSTERSSGSRAKAIPVTSGDRPADVARSLAGETVRIISISADDGRGGIAKYNTIVLEFVQPTAPGFTYWIIAHLTGVNGDDNTYFAKQQIYFRTGHQAHGLQFDALVDSVRHVYVVEADQEATAILRRNNELPMDGSMDRHPTRVNPPRARIVSSVWRVVKTRDEP